MTGEVWRWGIEGFWCHAEGQALREPCVFSLKIGGRREEGDDVQWDLERGRGESLRWLATCQGKLKDVRTLMELYCLSIATLLSSKIFYMPREPDKVDAVC